MHRGSTPVANARAIITNLTNSAQSLIAAAGAVGDLGSVIVLGVVVAANGSDPGCVILRAVDDSPEYMRIAVAGNSTTVVDFPWSFKALEGLEAITVAAVTATLTVTVLYWKPGAAGLGS